MRELNYRNRRTSWPQSSAAKPDVRLQTFAVYGAFLLIAAIVFGTIPFRPF